MMKQPVERYKEVEKLELKEIKKEFPRVFKKVHCPSCQEEVIADNLDLQNSLAKCGSCHVIFSIEEEVEGVKAKKEANQEFLRPEGIDLFHFRENLDITVQQHFGGLDIFGIIFLPILAGFSLLFYFLKGASIYFPIFFTIGTAYFIYRILNYSRNKIYIDINDKFLSSKYRPRNFNKDKTFNAAEIDQLYLKQSSDGMGYYTIYIIINGLEGQRHEKLLTVKTLSKAKYLEQEIEKYLRVEQRDVPEATA
ncbi:MAG: hypothetical protein OEM26_01300 [Saprospiraceae bacterium]|nr:hypothetical protein [Saprospiraceae bacterium]